MKTYHVGVSFPEGSDEFWEEIDKDPIKERFASIEQQVKEVLEANGFSNVEAEVIEVN